MTAIGRRLIVVLVTAWLPAAAGAVQREAGAAARFRYVLPEGFVGWACVDFGVSGAPQLRQDSDGIYRIEPITNGIVSTASFPYLTMFPFPSEVVQLTEGSSRRMEIGEIQRREQFDTMKPVSRSCLLFGSAEAADAVPRPPTLRESELGTAPLLRRFDFYQGSLCAFRELSARVCMDARDVRERRIGRTIVAAAGIAPVANGNCDRREDVHVIYRGEWLPTASPRDRRDVAVHAEVRLDRRGRGTVAGAVWSDNRGGTVDAVATRFGHDLAEFFTAATAATCAQ